MLSPGCWRAIIHTRFLPLLGSPEGTQQFFLKCMATRQMIALTMDIGSSSTAALPQPSSQMQMLALPDLF